MKLKTLTKNRIPRWLEILISVCSAAAFFLLVTAPNVNNLKFNTPFVLLFLLAGLRYGRQDTWQDVVSCKKNRVLLAAYGMLNCYFFYQVWCNSSAVARIGGILHIPAQILVLLTAVGLMAVSLPFVLKTLGLFLFFTEQKQGYREAVRQERESSRKILLVCFAVALGIITVCSKSSFLYPLNDWVDANCFFTVGKSMMNGVVIYRDLFEQKGPFLYFLHGIAWLISHDSFMGVYILEVIAATIFLYWSCRSVSLFVSRQTALLMVPVAAVVIYTSPAFCHGDSVEELCLPFLAYAIWVGLRTLTREEEISDREYLTIGITSGLVFWSKFIIVGFYIGWFLVPAALLLRKRAYRKLLRAVAMVAAGVLISTIPFVIYFGLNGAIGDWLKVYLYDNLFLYSNLEGESSGFLKNMKMGRNEMFYDNRIAYVLCVFGMLWLYLKGKDKPWKNFLSATFLTWLFGWPGGQFHLFGLAYLHRKKISKTALYMTAMLFFTFLFTYFGGQDHAYYAFIFSIFIPFGVTAVLDFLTSCLPVLETVLKQKLVPTLCIALSIVAAFLLTPNRYLMGVDRMELPQYQFAQIIGKEESPTLLNYGFLDGGFYTPTNIIPECKAFCKLNVPLEEQMQMQDEHVREGRCDFVVTSRNQLHYDNYALVAESSFLYEGNMRTYYLYQRK